MARSRNIKPGFFKNEQLVELPFETRLLFAGLWTLVDREGRTEDRPKKIKMELFPADSVDVDSMLTDLHKSGLIVRYGVGDSRYIEVRNFVKHQNPHPKEPASTIPGPESQQECGAEKINGESRKDTASRGKKQSSHALPSSNLNPESPIPAETPPGLDTEAWDRWLEYRKKIRKPLKSVSIPAAQRKLAAMGPKQAEAVERSIANGWQGLFEPEKPNQQTSSLPEY